MRVLLAFDRADCSIDAAKFVVGRRWSAPVTIKVLYVADPGLPAHLNRQAGAQLAALAEALRKKYGPTNVTFDIRDGKPVKTILRVAIDWSCDVIVVGSHGKRGIERLILGSVPHAIVKKAQCSVVVARPLRSGNKVSNVLFCLDDSPQSQLVLERVLRMRWPAGTNFAAATVIDSDSRDFAWHINIPGLYDADEHGVRLPSQIFDAAAFLDRAGRLLGSTFGSDRFTLFLREGAAHEQILEIAREWPADLIIMGSRGPSARRTLTFPGSVAEAVSVRAPCSVEIHR